MTSAEAWKDFKQSSRVRKSYPNQASESDKLDAILAEQQDIETSIDQLKDDISLMNSDEDEVGNISDLDMETEELTMPDEAEGLYDEPTEDEDDVSEEEVAETADTETDDETADVTDGGDDDEPVEDDEDEEDDDEEFVKVSKKNFDNLTKMILKNHARNEALAKEVRSLRASVNVIKAVQKSTNRPKEATYRSRINKSDERGMRTVGTGERVISRYTPPSRVTKEGKTIVTARPPLTAGYSGGHPDAITKMDTSSVPITIGRGTDVNAVAEAMRQKMNRYAATND